ncbi:MAG: type IX secretion system membrane protein PorP/SprF [Bacteroidales bacterium]|nr:type IX secretion system membrane protein PorP/SprF [Bacteroidales bacterium]
MSINRIVKYTIIMLLGFLIVPLKAQQLPIYSQYVLNGFLINPALAGHDGYTSFNTTARQQWVGFGDSPQTVSASWQTRLLARSYRIVNNPIRNQNRLIPSRKGRVGLGAYVINDVNGNVARSGVQFSYAFHISMEERQLSFGLAAKLFQYRINFDNLSFGRDVDQLANSGEIMRVGYIPDLDFGVHYTDPLNKFFVGLSVSNLMQSIINIGGLDNYQVKRHYWLMGAYAFDLDLDFRIEPTVLLKTTEDWVPQGDLGAKLYYKEDYWIGFAGRTGKTFITQLGFRKGNLYLGYAFDFTFSEIQRFNYGTHEVSISYKLGNSARRYRWLIRY